MSGRLARAIVASIAMCGVAGCAANIDAMKAASMERARGDADVAAIVRGRSAVLLTGADEVTGLRVFRGGVQGRFRRDGMERPTIGGCVAVPIDARGYWLTASHCAASGAALICVPGDGGPDRAAAAEIVRRSSRPGADIALLYAPFDTGVVPVAVSRPVRSGARVVCVGSGIVSNPLSAGHVVGGGGSTDGTIVWLLHDAPLSAGDSGGPVFYEDGTLAGINFEAGSTWSGDVSRATAIVPDMGVIAAWIDEDWHRRSGRP